MISRLFILALTFMIPLSATHEDKKVVTNADQIIIKKGCNSCNSCRQKPSAFELLQIVHGILDNNILQLPQLQPQLTQQLNQVINNSGIVVVGPQGPVGPVGVAGAAGTSGGILEYGYFYNLNAQNVAILAPVLLDTNGLQTAGFTHTPGTSRIYVVAAGTYFVDFSVSGTEPNQFGIYINGSLTPVPGSVYGSGDGSQQNNGQVIFTMIAGQYFELRNANTAAPAVGLATPIGGTVANVNASVSVLRIQ